MAKLIEKGKAYGLKEAIELAIKSSPVKFDASLEAHVRLGVDPRQADQNIRTTLVLPNGSGKTVRVAVFAPADICKIAKSAGADTADYLGLVADSDLPQLYSGTENGGQILDQRAEIHPPVGREIEDQLGVVQRELGFHQFHVELVGCNFFLENRECIFFFLNQFFAAF